MGAALLNQRKRQNTDLIPKQVMSKTFENPRQTGNGVSQRANANEKQQTINHLTDLMATISGCYYKGRLNDCALVVNDDGNVGINIDLYNFGGDGKPVCDGLDPCTITYDDGSQETGHLFCMCYSDDYVTPLVFLFSPTDGRDDIELDPEDVPTTVLRDITAWLEQEWRTKRPDPLAAAAAVQQAKDIIALWSDWCMDYDDENLWLDYMTSHPNGHCNRQHLQQKWDRCYGQYGNKAAMQMFWRELDNDNRAILTEYVTTQWHKD